MTSRRLISLAAATIAFAACGSDSSSESADLVEVRATDYTFLDVPDRIPAGTALTLSNTSAKEAHELVAVFCNLE